MWSSAEAKKKQESVLDMLAPEAMMSEERQVSANVSATNKQNKNKRRGSLVMVDGMVKFVESKSPQKKVQGNKKSLRTPICRHLEKFDAQYVAPEFTRPLNATQTASDLLNTLMRTKTLSRAVCDTKTGVVVGAADAQDFLHHLLLSIPSDIARKARVPKTYATIDESDKKALKDVCKHAIAVKLSLIKNCSGRNPMVPIEPETKLPEVVEIMATNCLLAPVTNPAGVFQSSLDHRAVMRLLAAQMEKEQFGNFADASIFRWHWESSNCFPIHQSTLVLSAMEQLFLFRERTSVLTVVNDEGQITGFFTAQFLLYMFSKKNPYYQMLWTLQALNRKCSMFPLITLDQKASTKDVVERMASKRTEVVWIVDKDKKPISMISSQMVFETLKDKFYLEELTDPNAEQLTPFGKSLGLPKRDAVAEEDTADDPGDDDSESDLDQEQENELRKSHLIDRKSILQIKSNFAVAARRRRTSQ
jgi:CBS domain-containing protein